MSDPNQSDATTVRYQVALLHYNDGLSRQMMLAEAVSQTLNCIWGKLAAESFKVVAFQNSSILSKCEDFTLRSQKVACSISGLRPLLRKRVREWIL